MWNGIDFFINKNILFPKFRPLLTKQRMTDNYIQLFRFFSEKKKEDFVSLMKHITTHEKKLNLEKKFKVKRGIIEKSIPPVISVRSCTMTRKAWESVKEGFGNVYKQTPINDTVELDLNENYTEKDACAIWGKLIYDISATPTILPSAPSTFPKPPPSKITFEPIQLKNPLNFIKTAKELKETPNFTPQLLERKGYDYDVSFAEKFFPVEDARRVVPPEIFQTLTIKDGYVDMSILKRQVQLVENQRVKEYNELCGRFEELAREALGEEKASEAIGDMNLILKNLENTPFHSIGDKDNYFERCMNNYKQLSNVSNMAYLRTGKIKAFREHIDRVVFENRHLKGEALQREYEICVGMYVDGTEDVVQTSLLLEYIGNGFKLLEEKGEEEGMRIVLKKYSFFREDFRMDVERKYEADIKKGIATKETKEWFVGLSDYVEKNVETIVQGVKANIKDDLLKFVKEKFPKYSAATEEFLKRKRLEMSARVENRIGFPVFGVFDTIFTMIVALLGIWLTLFITGNIVWDARSMYEAATFTTKGEYKQINRMLKTTHRTTLKSLAQIVPESPEFSPKYTKQVIDTAQKNIEEINERIKNAASDLTIGEIASARFRDFMTHSAWIHLSNNILPAVIEEETLLSRPCQPSDWLPKYGQAIEDIYNEHGQAAIYDPVYWPSVQHSMRLRIRQALEEDMTIIAKSSIEEPSMREIFMDAMKPFIAKQTEKTMNDLVERTGFWEVEIKDNDYSAILLSPPKFKDVVTVGSFREYQDVFKDKKELTEKLVGSDDFRAFSELAGNTTDALLGQTLNFYSEGTEPQIANCFSRNMNVYGSTFAVALSDLNPLSLKASDVISTGKFLEAGKMALFNTGLHYLKGKFTGEGSILATMFKSVADNDFLNLGFNQMSFIHAFHGGFGKEVGYIDIVKGHFIHYLLVGLRSLYFIFLIHVKRYLNGERDASQFNQDMVYGQGIIFSENETREAVGWVDWAFRKVKRWTNSLVRRMFGWVKYTPESLLQGLLVFNRVSGMVFSWVLQAHYMYPVISLSFGANVLERISSFAISNVAAYSMLNIFQKTTEIALSLGQIGAQSVGQWMSSKFVMRGVQRTVADPSFSSMNTSQQISALHNNIIVPYDNFTALTPDQIEKKEIVDAFESLVIHVKKYKDLVDIPEQAVMGFAEWFNQNGLGGVFIKVYYAFPLFWDAFGEHNLAMSPSLLFIYQVPVTLLKFLYHGKIDQTILKRFFDGVRQLGHVPTAEEIQEHWKETAYGFAKTATLIMIMHGLFGEGSLFPDTTTEYASMLTTITSSVGISRQYTDLVRQIDPNELNILLFASQK